MSEWTPVCMRCGAPLDDGMCRKHGPSHPPRTATCHCQREIVQLPSKWIHVDDGVARCYPDNTHPVDRQLRARPLETA